MHSSAWQCGPIDLLQPGIINAEDVWLLSKPSEEEFDLQLVICGRTNEPHEFLPPALGPLGLPVVGHSSLADLDGDSVVGPYPGGKEIHGRRLHRNILPHGQDALSRAADQLAGLAMLGVYIVQLGFGQRSRDAPARCHSSRLDHLE